MRSIRRDLGLRIGGAALMLLFVGGFGLYFSLRKALATQFDHILATKAQALVTASEIDRGEFEIDLDVQAFAGFGSNSPGDYFEVFAPDGTTVERSPSLGADGLTWPEGFDDSDEGFADLILPGGSPGRAYWTSFTPSIDSEEEEGEEPAVAPTLRLLVASDDSGHHRTLRTVALFIGLFGGGSVLAILAILQAVVKAGLMPLDRLSADVQRIDVRHLANRLPLENLPAELRGVAAKLNELLERLETSFAREKRFTSDAAHELRTPLAELRAMTELVTRWPEEFTPEHGQEMLAALVELEDLLDKLSLLAKADSEALPSVEAVDLEASLRECLDRLRVEAAHRRLRVTLSVENGPFLTDPALWRAIVGNLVGNAVAYAPEGGEVRVSASPRFFFVENGAPDLDPADVGRLFERFWRKSAARSEKGHSGLGLSVARAGIEFLGGVCTASLDQGRLRIEARWPDRRAPGLPSPPPV